MAGSPQMKWTSLKTAVASGQISGDQLKQLTTQYGDLFGAGAGQALVAIAPAGTIAVPPPIRSLGDTRASAEVLAGTTTLSPGSKHPAVLTYQHALNALANRMGKPEWGLLGSGADGTYGPSTSKAVSAFQTANNLPVTGNIDQMTALKMEDLLTQNAPPDIGGVKGTSSLPSGDKIAQAARDLVAKRGPEYGIAPPWHSPNTRIGAGQQGSADHSNLGASHNHWKCNRDVRHWARAVLRVARSLRNTRAARTRSRSRFPTTRRGPMRRSSRWARCGPPRETQTRTEPRSTRCSRSPGCPDDSADREAPRHRHRGWRATRARVVVANNYAKDGTVDCAQAGSDAAHIEGETINTFTGEDAVYLLRAAQKGS